MENPGLWILMHNLSLGVPTSRFISTVRASQSMHRCKHEFCRSEFCPLCNGHLLRTKSAYISEMVHLWGEYPKEDAHQLPEMGRKIKIPKSKYSKCNLEGGS